MCMLRQRVIIFSLPPRHVLFPEKFGPRPGKLLSLDEDYRRKYLVRHATDTNDVEDIFLLGLSVRGCLLEWNLVLKGV